jgi:glycosyltransferase involved in cell wall biosynthesis
MRVSQILCAAGPVDAVTNQGLACRSLFDSFGWDGADYSPVIAPGIGRRTIRHLHELRPARDEVLLLHYSGYARGLEPILSATRRSLLISHNITPARYFWDHEPVEAVRCELGRAQLGEQVQSAGALAGVSEFNASELHELSGRPAEAIPVLFDHATLAPAAGEPSGPPLILFVGRLTPHKRQDAVIRAFARFHRRRPEARLVLVGVPLSPAYRVELEELAGELAPDAVSFEHGVSRERLAKLYQSAHAFLCLSEHEGFCIPLLEAFHFGVPVVARNAGAVGEVVADAGVLLDPDDDLDTVAELLQIVTTDSELRQELRSRGHRRLDVYDPRITAERLRGRLTELAAA